MSVRCTRNRRGKPSTRDGSHEVLAFLGFSENGSTYARMRRGGKHGNLRIRSLLAAEKGEASPEAQIAEMARKAEELGGSLKGGFRRSRFRRQETAILSRPAGKEMLETLQAGDTLIVPRLDRLGYSMRDIRKTVEALYERGVRIHVLHALDGELNLPPRPAKSSSDYLPYGRKPRRRSAPNASPKSAQWRKENGLAYGGMPMGKKIVERNGVKLLEWDMKQLEYIAEIAGGSPRKARRRSPRISGNAASRTATGDCGASRRRDQDRKR